MIMPTGYISEKSFRQCFDAIRTLDPSQLIAKDQRYKHSINDVKLGGFIKLNGQVCYVTRCGRYDEYNENYTKKEDYSSNELRLLNLVTGEVTNIEIEIDDGELEVCASTAQLKFRDLKDDGGEGIDEDDLESIIDEEDSIYYNGKEFSYDDDWAAMYHGQDSTEGEKAYMYEFEASDGTCLTIEEWNGGKKSSDYEIWISESKDPDSINIISIGG